MEGTYDESIEPSTISIDKDNNIVSNGGGGGGHTIIYGDLIKLLGFMTRKIQIFIKLSPAAVYNKLPGSMYNPKNPRPCVVVNI